ncbi:MAG: hypothetical protein AAF938_27770 [Myxococcota bacterium]
MKKALILFLLGGGGGAAGYHYGKPQVMPHLAPFLGEGPAELEGVVVEKRQDEERLVLVLRSGDETFLASFRERMSDVATLVHEGDTVVLESTGDVFTEDVPILRVRRGRAEGAGARPEGGDADRDENADGSEDAPEGGLLNEGAASNDAPNEGAPNGAEDAEAGSAEVNAPTASDAPADSPASATGEDEEAMGEV